MKNICHVHDVCNDGHSHLPLTSNTARNSDISVIYREGKLVLRITREYVIILVD